MSIARLKKISVVGRQADKHRVMDMLQTLGVVHLLPLSAPESHPEKVVSREAEEAYKALRFLAVVPGPRRQMQNDPGFDVTDFVAKTLALRADLITARDRREALVARLAKMRKWGRFTLPEPGALGGQLLWFYEVPVKERASLWDVPLPWKIVGADHKTLFVVVVSPQEPQDSLLPVPRMHLGSRTLAELEQDLERAELEIEELMAKRHADTRYLTLLRAQLSAAESAAEMAYALTLVRDDPELFALQGWVPDDRLNEVRDICADQGLAMLAQEPDRDETPPTLLEQPQEEAAGVSLAMFYQVPDYRGWDPTILLLLSFTLFFAMILADAGYGLILLCAALIFWRRLDHSVQARSWRRLWLVLSGATIVYGMLVGSYFGAAPRDDARVLNSFAVLDLNDFATMMRLSILVGVLHLALAHAMAFRANPAATRWANLAWIGILIGSFAIWLSGQTGPWFVIGAGLATAGLVGLILFSSARPVNRPLDWVWRLFDGVTKLSGLMGMFGDVLSYMRLFALGLASASLAITFNDLAFGAMSSRSGLGILGGLLILLIGHALNLGLGLMSGVVHGLRLNYIEFYKWGLPEEGIAFRAFARREVQE